MKARRYTFISVWKVRASRNKVWYALSATPFSWAKWWPELTELRVTEIAKDHIGTRFSCVWRVPSGYRLRCHFTFVGYDYPKRLELASSGDLAGTANWYLHEAGGATTIRIVWKVHTTKRWMNLLAPLLKPLFIKNHDRIMKHGEAGLNAYFAN